MAGPVGEILSTKGQYKKGWSALTADNNFEGAHKSRRRLEDYLMALVRKRRLKELRGKKEKFSSFR